MREIKVAVFNDTATDNHFGCDSVMATIDALVRENGGRIVYRHSVARTWVNDPAAIAGIDGADLVLVNGEGSIHHSSWRAHSLSSLGSYCADLAKPCFLINATVQDNSEEIVKNISRFKAVWVRESSSQSELSRFGVDSTACGDLSLFHEHNLARPEPRGVLVLDSVDKQSRRKLIKVAKELNTRLVSMKHVDQEALAYSPRAGGFISRIRGSKPQPTQLIRGVNTFSGFAAYMAQHEYLITGRFHGFCFGISLGMPMSIVASSTWKTEAMLADIGLDARRVISGDMIPELLPLSDRESKNIQGYVERTRGGIRDMFRDIFKQVE